MGDKNRHMGTLPNHDLSEALTLAWSLVSRPLRASFGISRGSKNYALSLRVELRGAKAQGCGESVPYKRYGEDLATVRATMDLFTKEMQSGQRVDALLERMPGGCVREAIDAARWDYLCKSKSLRIRELLGVQSPALIRTCYTVSLDDPEAMAQQAMKLQDFSSLKLKLGGGELDIDRIEAVAQARPDAQLVADANEGWCPKQWSKRAAQARDAGLSLIEQPLPQNQDEVLGSKPRPLPCFADESVHGLESLDALVGRYDGVNIKLGKCGGVDRALEMVTRARGLGFQIMVGCMVGSSRSIAPALVVAAQADVVDLDAHLWLANDVKPSLEMRGDQIVTDFPSALWG